MRRITYLLPMLLLGLIGCHPTDSVLLFGPPDEDRPGAVQTEGRLSPNH